MSIHVIKYVQNFVAISCQRLQRQNSFDIFETLLRKRLLVFQNTGIVLMFWRSNQYYWKIFIITYTFLVYNIFNNNPFLNKSKQLNALKRILLKSFFKWMKFLNVRNALCIKKEVNYKLVAQVTLLSNHYTCQLSY